METFDAPRTGPNAESMTAAEPMRARCLVRTTDINSAESAGAKLLSENHLLIPRGGAFDAHIHGATMDSIGMYYLRYGTELEVVAPPLGDYIAVTLPLTGSMRASVGANEFLVSAGRSAAIIAAEGPLRMHWSPDFSMLCARIKTSALTDFVRHILPGRGDGSIDFAQLITRTTALDAIWGAARLFTDVFERLNPTDRPPPLVARQLREHFLTALVFTQPNTYSSALCATQSSISHHAVEQAVEIIESSPELMHTVVSIARTIGVSPRSLHGGFRTHLDTSPASYLNDVRLTRVRRDLTTSSTSDGTTVVAVAMRWGFSNPGRMAGYYRRRFGESPSETLANSRRHSADSKSTNDRTIG